MLALTAFHIVVLVGAAFLLLLAAVHDAWYYRVPNRFCLGLLVLFPVFVLTAPQEIDWVQHLMVFILILLAGFAMYVGKMAGAGDIKLLAVTGLWAGPHFVAVFLLGTAIFGGVLALVVALKNAIRNAMAAPQHVVALARVPIPYGVAIALGGFCTLYKLSEPILFP